MTNQYHQHICPDCGREWGCDRDPCGHREGMRVQPWGCVLCFFDRKGGEVATPERLKQIYG